MNLPNYYWWFEAALSTKFCDDVIKLAKTKKEEIALTGGQGSGRDVEAQPLSDKELKDLKKKRDSNIVWMNDKWMYDEIFSYVHTANRSSGWNFEFDFGENFQFTKYSEGQYYDWHCDSWDKPYTGEKHGKDYIGKIRKLSAVINLSSADEYEGGCLEFDLRNKDPGQPTKITADETRSKGSVIVFPSHVWHRVTPVTKGTRYSLVLWCLGKPFR